MVLVGTAITNGPRVDASTNPAMASGLAASGTAITDVARPEQLADRRLVAKELGERGQVHGAGEQGTAATRSRPRSDQAAVVLLHRGVDTTRCDQLDRLRGTHDRLVEQFALGLRDAVQDVVGAVLLRGRLADADPHPGEVVGLQVLGDGAQPVVAGEPAAELHPDGAGGRSSSSCTITIRAGPRCRTDGRAWRPTRPTGS